MISENLEEFRATRARTQVLVADVAQADLDYRPRSEQWSVGEILDHLMLAEGYFRREIMELIRRARAGQPTVLRRGFAELDIGLRFIPRGVLPLLEPPLTSANLFLPAFVREFLVFSRLVPARHPTFSTPRRGRPAEELRAELTTCFQETEALFAANPDLDYRQLVHIHPLLGINDVPHLLRIVTRHEQRHQGSIADVLRSLPAADSPGRSPRAVTALAPPLPHGGPRR
jgi:uncharacterized damage-inducible protein DinB